MSCNSLIEITGKNQDFNPKRRNIFKEVCIIHTSYTVHEMFKFMELPELKT
jgi:hypothetical protein